MSDSNRILEELQKVQRDIVESRNMSIKTDTTVHALFAELKKVQQSQRHSTRRTWLTSIGAYVLFLLLIGALGYFYFTWKTDELREKLNRTTADFSQIFQQSEAMRLELEARDSAAKRTLTLIKLIEEKKKEEAVAEYQKLDLTKLSKAEGLLLGEKIESFKKDLAKRHFEMGVSQWKIGGFKSAIQELNLSLAFDEAPENLSQVRYYLCLSHMQDRDYAGAMENLNLAGSAGLPKDQVDQLRLKIADGLNAAGRYDDALNYLNSLLEEDLSNYARQGVQERITLTRAKIEAKKERERKREEEEVKKERELQRREEQKAKAAEAKWRKNDAPPEEVYGPPPPP